MRTDVAFFSNKALVLYKSCEMLVPNCVHFSCRAECGHMVLFPSLAQINLCVYFLKILQRIISFFEALQKSACGSGLYPSKETTYKDISFSSCIHIATWSKNHLVYHLFCIVEQPGFLGLE